MSIDQQTGTGNELVDFWNEILVPKFIEFKHVLVGGLSHHSEKVFATLEVGEAVRRHDELVDVKKQALKGYQTPEGVVMGSSSWKITARNPG